MGTLLPVTRIFVPDCVPFFITRAHAQGNVNRGKDAVADTSKSKKPRYSVRRTSTETTDDVKYRSTDLENPDNLKSEVSYDEKSGTYHIGTTLSAADDKGNDSKNQKEKAPAKSSSSRDSNDKHATNVKLGSFLPANENGLNLTTVSRYLTPPVVMTLDEYMNWSSSWLRCL